MAKKFTDMPFIVGLVIVAAVIYFAFISRPGDTRREAFKKIAQTVVVLLMTGLLALLFIITCHRPDSL
jgi:hypothetical protein